MFYEDELIVIAPVEHPLAVKAPGRRSLRSITARELCAQGLVLREQGSGTREVLLRALADAGTEPREIVLTLANVEAIKRAVIAGLGLAVISRLCVTMELAGGLLAEIPVRDLKLRRAWYQLTLRGRQPSPSAEVFAALLARLPRP
jgi:DNA-binding transcriptional LysR family regulator